MRRARILVHDIVAGILEERQRGSEYLFTYNEEYQGPPVSLSMPVKEQRFSYNYFPPFLDGLLPEGAMLDALLRQRKIDRTDCFSQLLCVGRDLVGAITVEEES